MSNKHFYVLVIMTTLFFTACSPNEEVVIAPKRSPLMVQKVRSKKLHPYGGWSCPDNIIGFPAVNLEELDRVLVVQDRLPTKEETEDGTSLLYFDPAENLDVKPLDIPLPQLARFYSKYTKRNELVIVIQAVIAEQDTVVGFRYLNGGNGSAWYDELDYMTENETAAMGPTPFVVLSSEISATRAKIWEIITEPFYANDLGGMFGKNTSQRIKWKKNAQIIVPMKSGGTMTGEITAFWQDQYIQIDYEYDGHHLTDKFVILEKEENNNIDFHLVAGPYRTTYAKEKIAWELWIEKVKELAER